MSALQKRRENLVFKKTVEYMKNLGTYKVEFETLLKRYAQMRVQFDGLNEEWTKDGCRVCEEYTNNSGAVNERKTALYSAIEKLRTDLTDIESQLGLTPKGLKTLKNKGLEGKKASTLDKLFE